MKCKSNTNWFGWLNRILGITGSRLGLRLLLSMFARTVFFERTLRALIGSTVEKFLGLRFKIT